MIKGIMKGIGIGVAVGGTAAYIKGAMAGAGMKRSAKKRANRTMKTFENIVGDVRYLFK